MQHGDDEGGYLFVLLLVFVQLVEKLFYLVFGKGFASFHSPPQLPVAGGQRTEQVEGFAEGRPLFVKLVGLHLEVISNFCDELYPYWN